MEDLSRIEVALLELGLEDLIPLPEAVADIETLGTHPGVAVDAVSTALRRLLEVGRIQVWAGRWSDEAVVQGPGAANELLADRRRYSFAEEEAFGLDRVYYVNVDNLYEVPED